MAGPKSHPLFEGATYHQLSSDTDSSRTVTNVSPAKDANPASLDTMAMALQAGLERLGVQLKGNIVVHQPDQFKFKNGNSFKINPIINIPHDSADSEKVAKYLQDRGIAPLDNPLLDMEPPASRGIPDKKRQQFDI
ncbi:MAG: hypothetical protein HY053_07160 [Proteobacteria bacterium]|nr:hypothetical protein [Pseudomonadota bacterium]